MRASLVLGFKLMLMLLTCDEPVQFVVSVVVGPNGMLIGGLTSLCGKHKM